MCVVCVSAVTVASLLAPTEIPSVKNNVSGYTITKSACPKSKLNKVQNNKICLKDGTVYRWAIKNTQVSTTPAPKPTSTPTPTPKPSAIPTPERNH